MPDTASVLKPGRYAAIDIGTVTSRMLVADIDERGCVHELDREYAITNLGEGVDKTRRLRAEAIERVAHAVEGFLQKLDSLPGAGCETVIRAITTSAARDAENSDEFVARLAKLGVNVEVIPGTREAALSFAGASQAFDGERIVVVDVGGGSTEVISGVSGCAEVVSHSFDIGCRRVTEKFLASDPPSHDEIAAAREWMRQQFGPYFDMLRVQGMLDARLVAVAGTATTAVSIRENMAVYDTDRVHLSVVTEEDLRELIERLAPMTLEQRKQVIGLDPGRAPVIVGGFIVLDEVVQLGGFDSFTVSESDILQGIVADTARR